MSHHISISNGVIMEPIISVNHVSKIYRPIGFRPKLRYEAGQMIRRWMGLKADIHWEKDPFWALKDINFTVQPGESVGIVGRNGAGKTTLLRLLSGIMEASEGSIEVTGRFATLIGLGAGFDFHRSGKENIYLNAAIFGFPPSDVDEVIHQITEFSELGEFLDRPIKKYSSGMIARLGFSIAVHILPDIIFLDEVLSVGDIAFQQKCIERMKQLKEQNCTFLYVSHDPASLIMLCERSIWLHHGEMLMDGPTTDVIAAYKDMLGMTEPQP